MAVTAALLSEKNYEIGTYSLGFYCQLILELIGLCFYLQ